MNKVTLIGNVVRELELKTYDGSEGKGSYTKFILAVNEYRHKDKDNNAVFINVVAFGRQAEILGQYVTKGSKLGVEGKINTDSYINSKGEKKYGFVVTLERFYFLDMKKEQIS